jgi:hypothetical protein
MKARAGSRSTYVRRIVCLVLCLAPLRALAADGDTPPARPGFGRPVLSPTIGPLLERPEATLGRPLAITVTFPNLIMPRAIDEPLRPADTDRETDEPPRADGHVQPARGPVTKKPAEGAGGAESPDLGLKLSPPRPDVLFRLESESALRHRIRKEALANPKLPRPDFPEDRPQTPGTVEPRAWPSYTWMVEPNYTCHGWLYFEQVGAERFGRDYGPVQPLLSLGIFYYDVLAVPLRGWLLPWHCPECNSDHYSPFFDGWPLRHP